MDKVPNEKIDPTPDSTVVVAEIGAASELTRGMAIQWPWYEYGTPPFIHTFCTYC